MADDIWLRFLPGPEFLRGHRDRLDWREAQPGRFGALRRHDAPISLTC